MRVENGVYQVNENYSGCGASCTAAAALAFPNVPFPVTGPSLSTALYPSGGEAPQVTPVNATGTGFHGLALEEALPWKMSLSIGFVGSRGLRLPVFMDANLVGQTPHGLRSFNVTDKGTTNLVTVPYYLATDRIDTTLTSINAGFSVANSRYNSMAITLRKPIDHGLEVLANYTWAKAMDDDMISGNYGTFFGGNPVLDPNNLKGEYGRSDLDMRNRFVGSILWKPAILEDNEFMKKGLDGFTFSGIATESTGFPIVAGMSGTVSTVTGLPSSAAPADGNIFGGAMSSSSGAATTGRPPQIQRNSQVGPGVRNIDLRVTREIPIREHMSVQFIGEAFNLLNHEIVSGVNSSYSTYNAPTKGGCPASATVPAGSNFYGCITPYAASSPYQAFGQKSSTNNTLYGPRQLQVSAKLIF